MATLLSISRNVADSIRGCLPFAWLFLSFLPTTKGQYPDSELYAIGQAISDTAYFLEQQGLHEQADQYYRKTIQFAQQHQFPVLEGINNRYLGLLFRSQGQYDSALLYFRKGLPLLEEGKDSIQQAKLISDIGNLFSFLGDFPGAIEQYIEASKRFEMIGQDSVNGLLFANLGYAFHELDDFVQSEWYSRKALDLAEQYQMGVSIGYAALNLGSALDRLGQVDSARFYYAKALGYGKTAGDKGLEMRVVANLAGLESKAKNYAEAVNLIRYALELAPSPDQHIAMEALLGKFLTLKGEYVEARTHLMSSLQMAREKGLKEDEREALKHLADLEAKVGHMQQANQYLSDFIVLSDSLQNEAILQQSKRLTVLYETERKDKENQILQTENAEKARELQVAETRSLRNLLLFVLFAGLFLLTALVFWFYRNNAEQKRKLAEQEVEMNQHKLDQLKQSHQLNLMKAMLEGQEAERNRLAKDLHDGLGGLLSTARLQFDQVKEGMPVLEEHEDFDRAASLLQKAGAELRQIAHDLMPANLLKFGLITALEDFISEINFSQQLQVDLQYYGIEGRLPEIYEISLYRIVQELIHNVLKHAQATEVLVQLFREEDSLHLTVEDDGIGIPTDQWELARGQGIRNIYSRVKYLDGEIEIHSQPGEGTTFLITLELKHHDTTPHRG